MYLSVFYMLKWWDIHISHCSERYYFIPCWVTRWRIPRNRDPPPPPPTTTPYLHIVHWSEKSKMRFTDRYHLSLCRLISLNNPFKTEDGKRQIDPRHLLLHTSRILIRALFLTKNNKILKSSRTIQNKLVRVIYSPFQQFVHLYRGVHNSSAVGPTTTHARCVRHQRPGWFLSGSSVACWGHRLVFSHNSRGQGQEPTVVGRFIDSALCKSALSVFVSCVFVRWMWMCALCRKRKITGCLFRLFV